MNRQEHKKLYKNPFSSNIIYMYYYTEKRLITSIIEIFEENDVLKVKYYNGVKDIAKYADNVSYKYEGILESDKTIGYINLRNTNFENTQLEKLQISFNISWSNDSKIKNAFIIGVIYNLKLTTFIYTKNKNFYKDYHLKGYIK